MLRLVACLQIILGTAWIAGYLAIVLPVIFDRMQPGTQNGNFTFWADAGYFFLICLAPCMLYWAWYFAKQTQFIRCAISVLLLLAISIFQFWGHTNTYQVANASEQRNQYHENSKLYKQHDATLQTAHKASERIVGFLIILLLTEISLSVLAIQCKMDQSQPGGNCYSS